MGCRYHCRRLSDITAIWSVVTVEQLSEVRYHCYRLSLLSVVISLPMFLYPPTPEGRGRDPKSISCYPKWVWRYPKNVSCYTNTLPRNLISSPHVSSYVTPKPSRFTPNTVSGNQKYHLKLIQTRSHFTPINLGSSKTMLISSKMLGYWIM